MKCELRGCGWVIRTRKSLAGATRKLTKMRARFRRRAAIEPVISHLKHQYRLMRCFLKGFVGDQVNLLLAAAAWNLKKWLRAAALSCLQLFRLIAHPQTPPTSSLQS